MSPIWPSVSEPPLGGTGEASDWASAGNTPGAPHRDPRLSARPVPSARRRVVRCDATFSMGDVRRESVMTFLLEVDSTRLCLSVAPFLRALPSFHERLVRVNLT